MNLVLILVILIAILFVVAFFTQRRFGLLALALAAGATLSSLWASTLAQYFENAGIVVESPPLQMIVAVVLVLLPPVLLLGSGPRYHSMRMRLVGAACFALLATVFLLEPIGNNLILVEQSKDIYDWLVTNQVYIVTAGLAYAIFDVLTTKTPKANPKAKH